MFQVCWTCHESCTTFFFLFLPHIDCCLVNSYISSFYLFYLQWVCLRLIFFSATAATASQNIFLTAYSGLLTWT